MSGSDKQPAALIPPESDLAFFGQITASVTHELNNVISIIDQTAGLLDDLVAGEERGIPIAIERLAAVSASIQKQTQRGLGIVEHLNRFAHSTDSLQIEFDINDTIGNLIELARRPAGLRKVQLAYQPAAPLRMNGNPFAVQHALFESILAALTCCPPDSVLTVENQATIRSVCIAVTYDSPDVPDQKTITKLENTLASARGSLRVEATPSVTRLSLQFPPSPSS